LQFHFDMKTTFAAVLVLCAMPFSSHAQSAATLPRLFVDADQGFNIYLAAAIQKKQVSVTLTTDRSKADYVLEGVSEHRKRLGLKQSILYDWMAPVYPQIVTQYDSASVQLVSKSGAVVFAYSVDRNNTVHGRQTAAESIAKHLKAALIPQPNGGLAFAPQASLAQKVSAWPWKPEQW